MNARPDPNPVDLRAAIRRQIEEKWPESASGSEAETAGPSWLRPYVYRDPSEIPRRQWLYGDHYIRDFTSATFAPGGVGKSVLCMTEGLSMALGRPLIGGQPTGRYRVAYWNGEDPAEEIERRVAALHLEYGIRPGELDGWFFMGSGREHGLTIAEQASDGTRLCVPVVENIKACVRDLQLDALIIDPFVSSHRVPENDNNAVDMVAKAWGRIAGECNISVELSHHTVKHTGRATTVEDGRGGGALLFAVRSARVLNVMTGEEAEAAGVPNPLAFLKVSNGKANLAPRTKGVSWYRFVGVDLGNHGPDGEPGDSVGVLKAWAWPEGAAATSKLRLGAAAQAIWNAYGRLQDDGNTCSAPAVPGVQPGAVAVTEGHLKTMALRLRLVTEPKPDGAESAAMTKWQAAGRKAWQRGVEQLQAAGLMRFEAGCAWGLRGATGKANSSRGTSRDDDDGGEA